jgi:protein SCO1
MPYPFVKPLIALALLLSLGACQPASAPEARAAARFSAVDITGADYGAQLKLPDAHGQERSLAEFKGKLVYVFFGFTHCPDVCPLTMADLAQVKKELGADGERVQGIFITLDPERDTPAALQAYVQGFDPSFIALRGSPEQTQAAARSFKIYYAKVPGKTPESYTLDHTAGSYIFDPKGQLRLFTRYAARDEKPGGLKADMLQLLQGR